MIGTTVMVEQLTNVSLAVVDLDPSSVTAALKRKCAGYARHLGHDPLVAVEEKVNVHWSFCRFDADHDFRPEVPYPVARRHPDFEPMPWTHLACASLVVPRVPLRYPVCGLWSCDDDADWESVDPLLEPSEYAGVAIERDIVYDPRHGDWWREVLEMRRRETDGYPLWHKRDRVDERRVSQHAT